MGKGGGSELGYFSDGSFQSAFFGCCKYIVLGRVKFFGRLNSKRWGKKQDVAFCNFNYTWRDMIMQVICTNDNQKRPGNVLA